MNNVKIILIVCTLIFLLLFISYMVVYPSILYGNKYHETDLSTIYNKTIDNKYNIAIITIETRELDILQMHNENLQSYADIHGYDYLFRKEYTTEDNLPIYWCKLHFMKEILHKYDYVLWLDSDTLICNKHIGLDQLIEMDPNASVFIGKDEKLYNFSQIPYCAGVFMVKNDVNGHTFLDTCLFRYKNNNKCINDKNEYIVSGIWARSVCYEQGMMNAVLKENRNIMVSVPETFFFNSKRNNYNTVISHMFGRDKSKLYKRFLDHKQNCKNC